MAARSFLQDEASWTCRARGAHPHPVFETSGERAERRCRTTMARFRCFMQELYAGTGCSQGARMSDWNAS